MNHPCPSRDLPSFDWAAAQFPRPGTKRVYLHQPGDTHIVKARPDLKFQIQPATGGGDLIGVGFVLLADGRCESFDFDRTEHSFEDGALPLLTQRIVQAGFSFEQTSFTTADDGGRGFLAIRLRIRAQSAAAPRSLTLGWLSVRQPHARFHSHANEDYIVFEPWAPAWEQGLNLSWDGRALHEASRVFAAVRCTPNVQMRAASDAPAALVLTASLAQTEEAVIEARIPYATETRTEEAGALWAEPFDGIYARQATRWRARLAEGASITVPELIVSQIYRTLTLTNLQFLGSTPGLSHLKPGQGGFNDFSVVYAWESSAFLTVMDRQGYHREVRRALEFFLTTQQGARGGPEGDISTGEGSFRPYIHWMCETGSVLHIFAQHALYGRDWGELRADAPALLKAARWIQGERARTRELLPDGSRAAHYGLLPRGRGTDWPDRGYQFFSDANTWQGLDRLAAAFENAGLPDAAWLRAEADEYRKCIVAAVERSVKPHPLDPALKWVPDDIYEDPGKVLPIATWFGPLGLLGAQVFPSRHPLVPEIEASLRKSGCLSDLFAFRMKTMEDPQLKQIQEKSAGGPADLYYVTNWERIWHRIWMDSGKRVPALRFFYMMLTCATSRDVHMAHERFCPQLPWLLPWQPNASGEGRILSMILDALVYEDGDALCLLHGVPDAWFATRQPMGVTALRTPFGGFSFSVTRKPGDEAYHFSYECHGRAPKLFRLALPSGSGAESRRVVEIPSRGIDRATEVVR